MANSLSTPYDLRIQELRKRTRHPVRRRLLDNLAAQRAPFSRITGILGLVSAVFAECERRRSHGAVPMTFLRRLYHRRTLDRYLPILLAQLDVEGGADFYLQGETLHVCHLRHSVQDMARAEAKWRRERELARARKQRQRARATAQATPNTMAATPPSEAICDMSRSDSSLREEDLEKDKDKSFEQLAEEAVARGEAADAAVGHECPQGQEAEVAPMTSAEITEAAYREIEAERAKEPVRILAAVPPLRGQLTKWGYDAARAARHRFTERELAMAVEKVERAHTPLGNRAGAVVATILKWRRGEWMIGAAA